jgi:hypothetical protein
MRRPGLLVLVMVQSLVLTACPKEQMDPGGSAGVVGSTGATTAEPTTAALPTTGATSTSSGETPTEASSSTGTSGGSSTGEGTSGTSGGTSTGTSGLGGTGEGSTGAPPKLADCFGCLCDINVSFCRIVFAGARPAAFAGPESNCPIVEAMTEESGCVMYPPRCGEAPSCACLPTMDGGCFCNEIEPGDFQVACPLP